MFKGIPKSPLSQKRRELGELSQLVSSLDESTNDESTLEFITNHTDRAVSEAAIEKNLRAEATETECEETVAGRVSTDAAIDGAIPVGTSFHIDRVEDAERIPAVKFSELKKIRELKRGAAGIVYAASYFQEPVALKEMTDASTESLLEEANMQFNLRHPNVVELLGLNTDISIG